MLKYKGYVGRVRFDSDSKTFHGDVIGLRDVITFQGETAQEIEKAFIDSIEDYLEWCKELGRPPEKTFSGNLRLRMEPYMHADLAQKAALKGKSLNSYIIDLLKNEQS